MIPMKIRISYSAAVVPNNRPIICSTKDLTVSGLEVSNGSARVQSIVSCEKIGKFMKNPDKNVTRSSSLSTADSRCSIRSASSATVGA